ncbi:glutamyl endopeptidase [Microdochium nivale]|nr:glutamyl endopeptidase [Microdochium nivale]
MVQISRLAAGLSLGAAANAFSIPGPDENGVQVAMGIVPEEAFQITGVAVAETTLYDTATLRAMGELIAEPSNHTEPELGRRQIWGGDDRVDWTNSDYPYSAIGRLTWSNGIICTGTLVGPRHMITARHCTPKPGENFSVRFSPFFFDGETRFAGSQVVRYIYGGNREGECNYGEDWAVHILQDRIGEQRGWFGARAMTSEWLNRNIFYNFGYPVDRNNGQRPIRSGGNTLVNMGGCGSDTPTRANIDVWGGQSGGPLWEYPGTGDRLIMGTLFGYDARYSIFATGQAMVNAIIQARTDYP